MAGNKNNGDLDLGLRKFRLKIQATHARQSDIKNKTAGAIWPLRCEEFRCGREGMDLQSYGSNEVADCSTQRGIVINDENSRHGIRTFGFHSRAVSCRSAIH